jgi:hypothetical protein
MIRVDERVKIGDFLFFRIDSCYSPVLVTVVDGYDDYVFLNDGDILSSAVMGIICVLTFKF